MKRTTVLFLATFAVAPFASAQPCDLAARVCNVVVSVANCVPKPDVDPLPVKAGVSPVIINWRIAPASVAEFRFAARTGIVPPSNPQFSPITADSPVHVHLTDQNTDRQPTSHKYSINVEKKDGGACPTLDPAIINGAN